MSGTKFTPGPWSIESSFGDFQVRSDNGCMVIATMDDRETYTETLEVEDEAASEAEAHANAHLIGAAPNMFDALTRLNKVLWDGILNSDGNDVCDALKAMTAALARARGEKADG